MSKLNAKDIYASGREMRNFMHKSPVSSLFTLNFKKRYGAL